LGHATENFSISGDGVGKRAGETRWWWDNGTPGVGEMSAISGAADTRRQVLASEFTRSIH